MNSFRLADSESLWQIHEVVYDNDPKRIFRTNGTIEALAQAKKEGKVRFVGFQPMQALRDRCVQYVADGRFELFKTSKQFDADEGRIQYGFPPQSQVQT
jgi:predicted DCC family thiol-disulfide oxidoreductase YuxK